VVFREPNQGVKHKEYTDQKGQFQFVGLKATTYTVRCAPINPGPYSYSQSSPETVTLIEGEPPPHFVFKFRAWVKATSDDYNNRHP
jgi:hypothetical protein